MDVEGFKLVMECQASDSFLVRKYQSLRTGMLVLTADVPGPAVHGYFIVGK